MITEDFVSFETAHLLKEKGMNKSCFKHYVQKNNNDGTSEAVTVCTLQMAMKWLREKGIIITITYTMYSLQIDFKMMFGFKIQNVQGKLLAENTKVSYNSYEQAEMDATKYCLENLI